MSTATEGGSAAALAVEQNGINVIHESERKGAPRDLFWPWAAANISVFGIAYGAFLLYFGVSFWQALIVGAVGIAVSFFFVGMIALAGKRGHVFGWPIHPVLGVAVPHDDIESSLMRRAETADGLGAVGRPVQTDLMAGCLFQVIACTLEMVGRSTNRAESGDPAMVASMQGDLVTVLCDCRGQLRMCVALVDKQEECAPHVETSEELQQIRRYLAVGTVIKGDCEAIRRMCGIDGSQPASEGKIDGASRQPACSWAQHSKGRSRHVWRVPAGPCPSSYA